MKYCILLISLILFCSCIESNSDPISSEVYNGDLSAEKDVESYVESPQVTKANATKLYKIKSTQYNMLFGVLPIPQSWKVVDNRKDNILFEGPNGLKVYGDLFAGFSYSQDPQANYFYQQQGTKVMPPKSIQQVIEEDLKPYLSKEGWTYLGFFELEQLAKKDTEFDKALFKSVPENKTYRCVVTEWKHNNGKKSLGIIRYYTNYYTAMPNMDWGYTINALEVSQEAYESTKREYINTLLNLKINPNWIQKNNQVYANKSRQSSAQHQRRMAAIHAQGQIATQTANTYSSILDSSHDSWKRRNAMTDAGHSNTINSGIWERSTMQDQSGNQYQVQGYYDNVWKGTNDNYVGTNDVNWNPNIDSSTKAIDWEQLENNDDNY